MARRHVYIGKYTNFPRHSETVAAVAQTSHATAKDLRYLASMASQYMWTAYNMMNGNYLVLATVIAVALLSFLIPDISQKIHATSELKNMKNLLNLVTKEVGRAEVACLTAAEDICNIHCSMQDGVTETSISYKDLSVSTSQYPRLTMSDPLPARDKIGIFRKTFFPTRNTSHKEVAIMSYLYTNSFDDAQKSLNFSNGCDVLPPRPADAFDEK